MLVFVRVASLSFVFLFVLLCGKYVVIMII